MLEELIRSGALTLSFLIGAGVGAVATLAVLAIGWVLGDAFKKDH